MMRSDPNTDLTRRVGRLEGGIDTMHVWMRSVDKRLDRLTTENRWISVGLATLIGALGLWG